MRRILQSIMFLQGLLCVVALMGLLTAADADMGPNPTYAAGVINGLGTFAVSVALTAGLQWLGNKLRG